MVEWNALISRFSTAQTLQKALHSPIHTHIHAQMAGAAFQGANLPIRSNLGLSILPDRTSTCGLKEP